MSEFVPVARVDEVPPGTGRVVAAGDTPVALFNVDGEFHALENVCLHRGGPIGEGDLDGAIVTCPWHGFQYDVTTGALTIDREIGLRKHDVRVENDTVLVRLAATTAP